MLAKDSATQILLVTAGTAPDRRETATIGYGDGVTQYGDRRESHAVLRADDSSTDDVYNGRRDCEQRYQRTEAVPDPAENSPRRCSSLGGRRRRSSVGRVRHSLLLRHILLQCVRLLRRWLVRRPPRLHLLSCGVGASTATRESARNRDPW